MKLDLACLAGMAFLTAAALPAGDAGSNGPERSNETPTAVTPSVVLMWTVNNTLPALGFHPTFSQAQQLAEDHEENGFTDWRLPTVDELVAATQDRSFGKVTPAIARYYWTSRTQGKKLVKVVLVTSDVNGDVIPSQSGNVLTFTQDSTAPAKFVRESGGAPPITVTGISPSSMNAGETISVTITGTDFVAGAAVGFENGSGPAPSASGVTVMDPTTLMATVSVGGGGKRGTRILDVRVTNTDGSTGVLVGGFSVIK